MLILIQLVTHASLEINNEVTAKIQYGILGLVGMEKTDTEKEAETLVERVINYRIFPDNNGKMNHSLKAIQGDLLLVPQFTLVADTRSGTRPGFSTGMPPEQGKNLFEYLVNHAKQIYEKVSSGQFGAHMKISLCNDGPVTFLLQSK